MDAVCFHCQQCAEKYLKARLQQDRIVFGKTHNLNRSSRFVVAFLSDLDVIRAVFLY